MRVEFFGNLDSLMVAMWSTADDVADYERPLLKIYCHD